MEEGDFSAPQEFTSLIVTQGARACRCLEITDERVPGLFLYFM